jgi:protein tyrosine/serine phosphatase
MGPSFEKREKRERRALRPWIALVLIASHTALAAQETDTTSAVHIKRFSRINASYYRGAEPKRQDYERLASLGIRTVVDLKREGIAEESAIVRRIGMKFESIPMSPGSAPSAHAVTQFLKIVTDPANEPVFVHCEGGHDRTGALTAIYRMTHDGWTVDRAFREMKRNGYNSERAGRALQEFVFNYARSLASQTR